MRREVSSRPRAFNSAAKDFFRTVQRDYSQVRGCGFVALPDSDFFKERLRPIYYRRIGHQQGPGIVSKQYVDISPASSWTSPAGNQGPAARPPAPESRGQGG